jgi:SAM-dependent methyltransferase
VDALLAVGKGEHFDPRRDGRAMKEWLVLAREENVLMSEYAKSAEIYDAMYLARKDYAREAEQVHALIQEHKHTDGNALLDVACGTGLHADALRRWYHVEGLDLSEEQLAVARKRLPDVALYQADMTNFATGKAYDAIACLFGAIGELLDLEQVNRAIRRMAQHLKPGGVLIVEPWLRPEQFTEGRIWSVFVDEPSLKVARMTIAERHGNIVDLHMHYMVGRPGNVEEFVEHHQEALHTVDEYLRAFTLAGLDAAYDEDGLNGRGLYMATARSEG